ncbi:putative ethanolamine-phosphate cytidylyltransferase [Nosema granulosis]|uniref:ethanolamine-phosphate cytidylyltransferase n=1 Tax=Nosema granulosis TaxID=83296 RepID=A0A9P6H058_9MICR|nr:putative ethanolamine-phosphate cytidylyltransferase [Nosema granulosis]
MKKVWLDGCFDVFHYGHANAIRQARAYGDYVYVGIHSFEDIEKNKSLPVMLDDERYEVLKSCKWADEVVMNTPYVTEMSIVKKFGCSLVVHGNDIVTDVDGHDTYHKVKAEGSFKTVNRTMGISTTEIVGRMLLRESRQVSVQESMGNENINQLVEIFRGEKKEKSGKVIFIDGIFDLFHAGHAKALENAKKNGDYLLVGLHRDEEVKKYSKSSPIFNEKERLLLLLANKYVDEVIFTPYIIDGSFVATHQITNIFPSYDIKDLSRFSSVKEIVEHDFCENKFSYLSTDQIINRIITNYQAFADKQKKKNIFYD